jgi:hypothetical protein
LRRGGDVLGSARSRCGVLAADHGPKENGRSPLGGGRAPFEDLHLRRGRRSARGRAPQRYGGCHQHRDMGAAI